MSSGIWKKIRLHAIFAMSMLDFVTDLNANIIYWRNKDESSAGLEIAIFATISLALGFLILLWITYRAYIDDEEFINDDLLAWRAIETSMESIPQLWISLYVLSVSDSQANRERIYLYASATISFLIVASLLFEITNIFDEERIFPTSFKLLRVIWRSTLFFGRMTALAYMSVELDWWTALFIGFHLACFLIFIFIIKVFDTEGVVACLLDGLWGAVILVFFIVDIRTPNKTAVFFILYITQNVFAVLLTFLLWADKPFYLFSNFLVVNMSFHVISVVSFAIYYVILKRNPDYWSSQDENTGGEVDMTEVAATVNRSTSEILG